MPEPTNPSQVPSSSIASSSKTTPASTGTTKQDKKPSTPWQPKPKDPNATSGKSAKEEKKAKRAAAVAARGGPSGPPEQGHGKGKGLSVPASTTGITTTTLTTTTQTPARVAGDGMGNTTIAGTTMISTTSTSIAAVSTLLFSHLPGSNPPSQKSIQTGLGGKPMHPLIVRLGLLLTTPASNPVLRGTNARSIALLLTFKEIILTHTWPAREMHRVLPNYISPMIGFLDTCRPKGIAGGNVIRWLKSEINRIGTDESIRDEEGQKRLMEEAIDGFLRERIELADEVICDFAVEKIRDGDTIVTYARSSLVEKVLLEAWRRMKEEDEEATFHVVVVDSNPLLEGKALLRTLTSHAIPCSYTLLPSLSSLIPRASMVLLGTAALLSDGSLYSRAGTAMVAMLAKEYRIPVVAACETYKFGERVVLDAVTSNELGDASSLLSKEKDRISTHLTPIHLLYDLTPASLVTAVCTEVGFIPPSSVPTVISKPGEAAGF